MNRRTFLRILGLGAVAGPTLLKAAARPELLVENYSGIKLVDTRPGLTIEKLRAAKKLMDRNEPYPRRTATEITRLNEEHYNGRVDEIYSAYMREWSRGLLRSKDEAILKTFAG